MTLPSYLFAPSANQPCWEGLIWGHVWKSGQLNISDRKDQIRRWRSTYPLSRRWTFFAKTSCTSELSHTKAPRNADKPPQLHWFIHRTLPFSEFVKRASERKHSDFFLCEVTNVQTCFGCSTIVPTVIFSVASLQDESYYLRSLGEDVRKVQNRIIRMKTCCCFPAEALHGSVWLFNRNLLILADSFLTLLRIFTFHSSSPRSSFSPACSASALVVCSCGHTTMWAFFQF